MSGFISAPVIARCNCSNPEAALGCEAFLERGVGLGLVMRNETLTGLERQRREPCQPRAPPWVRVEKKQSLEGA
ncbi:MAG: hypothetical protein ABI318_05960 [Chthoniobacteraceae bacterium]